jgi:hypothetical protein
MTYKGWKNRNMEDNKTLQRTRNKPRAAELGR